MEITEILADPLLGGRKIISQRSRRTEDLDTFLAEMNMSRKRIPRDESNLYRAVADQLWGNQAQFQRVKTELHKHILSYNTQIPDDGNFTSSPFMDQLLGEFMLIASSVYKKDVCLFLQRGLVTQRYLYNKESSIASSESMSGRRVLYFSIDNELYWDSVYTFDEMATMAHNQAYIYNILYSGVFNLHGVAETVTTMLDRNQSFTVQCMRDRRSRDTLEKITRGDLTVYDHEQNLVVLTNIGVTPFPYKVAKCLSPFMYRNVSFDIWDSHQGFKSRGVYLRIGGKCVVHMKENIKCMGFVQELNNAKDTATVFIEELGKKCEIPQCLLEVVTTANSRSLGQFSRVDKMGRQIKTQRGIECNSLTNGTLKLYEDELNSTRNISRQTYGAPFDEASPNKRCLSPISLEHSDLGCGRFTLDDDVFKSSISSDGEEEDRSGHGFIDTENPCIDEEGTASYKYSQNAEAAPAYLSYEYEREALPSNCLSHIAEQDSEQGAANLLYTQSSQRADQESSPSSGNQQFAAGGHDAGDQQGVGVPRPDLLNFIRDHSNQPNFAGYLFEGPNNEGPMQPNMVRPTSYPNTPYYLPVDQNAYFSFAEDGSDLPYHDVNTLRYFYNHGIQYVLACQLQEYTRRPVFTSPPALVLCNNGMSQARVVGPIGVECHDGVIIMEEYPPNEFAPMVGHVLTTANMPWANTETANATAARAASATVQTDDAPVNNASTFDPLVGAPRVAAHNQTEGSALPAGLYPGVFPAPTANSNLQPQGSLHQFPANYSIPPPFNPIQQSAVMPHHQLDSNVAAAELYPGAPLVHTNLQPQGSFYHSPGNFSTPPPFNPIQQSAVMHHPLEGNVAAAELYPGAPLVHPFNNINVPQGSLPQSPGDFSIPPPFNPVQPSITHQQEESNVARAPLDVHPFKNNLQPQGSLPQCHSEYSIPPPFNHVTHHQTEDNVTAAELYTGAPLVRQFISNNLRRQLNLPQSSNEYSTPPPFNPIRSTSAPSDTQQSPTLQPLGQQPTEYNITIRTQPLTAGSSPLVSPPVVPNAQNVPIFQPWSCFEN